MPGDTARQNGKLGGRPKGSKTQKTLDRETLRLEYVRLQAEHLLAVSRAQFEASQGVSHMMAKDPETGQWIEVTNAKTMARCLNSGEAFYRIYAHNPDVRAAKDIIDQLIGTAPKTIAVTGEGGGPLEIVIKKPWA